MEITASKVKPILTYFRYKETNFSLLCSWSHTKVWKSKTYQKTRFQIKKKKTINKWMSSSFFPQGGYENGLLSSLHNFLYLFLHDCARNYLKPSWWFPMTETIIKFIKANLTFSSKFLKCGKVLLEPSFSLVSQSLTVCLPIWAWVRTDHKGNLCKIPKAEGKQQSSHSEGQCRAWDAVASSAHCCRLAGSP